MPLDPSGGFLGTKRRPPTPAALPASAAPPQRIVPQRREAHPGPSLGSVRGQVLAALAGLAASHAPEGVEVSRVVVAAWRQWPEHFSLAHERAYPCSQAVCARLAAPEIRPYIKRPAPGRVALTALGRRWWRAHAEL